PFASYTTLVASAAIQANGTATSAANCSTTGWTKITNAGDLAATLANTAYIVRIFESDALLNARCSDLSNGTQAHNQNAGATAFFNARGSFGVDKVAPTAVYVEPATDATAAPDNGACGVTCVLANFNVKIALSDDASGF